MNLLKTIAKTTAVALATFGMVATAFAASLGSPTGIPVLQVSVKENGSWSSYKTSTSVDAGERLAFQIHTYGNSGAVSGVKNSIEDIDGKTYSSGSSDSIQGRISASNAAALTSNVNLSFGDDVKLEFLGYEWWKRDTNGGTDAKFTLSNVSNVFNSSGVSMGSLGEEWKSNLILYFDVVDNGNTEPPADDVEVTTNSATSVDEDSARLNGEVAQGDNVEVWFALSESSSPSCSSTSQRVDVSGGDRDAGDSFSANVSSLDEDTKYYFRACGENSDGDDAGSIKSFTTDGNSNPTEDVKVTTNAATSVDEDSARLNGEVDEGDNVEVWFAFEEGDSTPSCSDSSQREDVSGGDRDAGDSFSLKIDGLDEDTKYYYRACGENSDGDDDGAIRSFTTDDDGGSNGDDIDVTTDSATDIEDNSARLNGELDEGDDAEVWFALDSEFGSSPSCSNSSQRESVSGGYDGGDDFFKRVTGLEDDTRYYYKACAEDDSGDADGSIRSFTTDGGNGGDEQVTTLSPTSVTSESARLNGRLDEGDENEVWFALSRTDSTPSCSDSSQREDVSGRYDDGDNFSETVTNLRDNSTYYYRACTEDSDGDDVFGSIRTFVTGGGSININSALTTNASSVGTVSARINGSAFGSGNGECYFNWGTSTFVPLKTADVGVTNSSSCTAFLSGLSPNTTYFYQTVLERNGITHKGAVRSFRTSSNLPPIIIPNPPVDPGPGTTIIRVVDRTEQDDDLAVTKWVSGEFDDNFVTAIDASRGEVVFYRVLVRNNTDETIEDVVVTDRIPFELELADNSAIDVDSDKELVWDIRELRPGEAKIFITEMRVREDTPVGLEIISFASAESDDFQTDSNNVLIEVRGGSLVDEENNGQAASIFGAGFFPDSLLGWLILLAILIAIAYLVSRLLFSRKESYKLNAELAMLEAERMNKLR